MRVADFDYHLPPSAIAQQAIEPRDASRLLVTDGLQDRVFSDVPSLVGQGDLLVVNRTRVRSARLAGVKTATGGAVEMLLVRRLDEARWEALLRPARRMRAGTALTFDDIEGVVETDPHHGVTTVRLSSVAGDVENVLPAAGSVPLPPYFKGELADPERYQTVFAKTVGSAAAPTAALHFTPRVVAALKDRGADFAEVELDIGLDTFRPMTSELVTDHSIHRERYHVPESTAAAVRRTRASGGKVIAIGTTVVRTLETAAARGELAAGEGESSLFIVPGYDFRVVDALLTNFHAPRTTLVALVAAAMGPSWRTAYETALERGYRFLSFGDAMFIPHVGNA